MAKETLKFINPKALTLVGLDMEEENSPLNDSRVHFEVDPNLVKNILAYGIQVPIIVRKEAGKTYVVDGRQRVKAARVIAEMQEEAGEHVINVPCIEVQAEDGRVGGIMISTNEHRRNDDVLSRARKAARLLDLTGNMDEVCLAFGRTQKSIENWLQLLNADPAVIGAVEEGVISASIGIELSALPRGEQREAIQRATPPTGPATHVKPVKAGKVEKAPKALRAGKVSPAVILPPAPVKEHPGVKKGFLRRVVKTKAFEVLEPEQRAVISWFVDGHVPENHWIQRFVDAVEREEQEAENAANGAPDDIPSDVTEAGAAGNEA